MHILSFIHNNSELNESYVGKYTNDNCILTFNPPPNLKLTVESNKKNPEHFINCGNLDIDEIQKMKIKPNSLSLFHTNSCFLIKNFEDLEYLLKATNKTFDVIAISESRILKDTNLSKNINIYNYSAEFTPTESQEGGALLYINKLSCKLRQDLCVYKSSELESTFIEIINPKKQISSLVVYIDIQ